MGKCRNSPIKRPTIPRLELLVAVMAVRLSKLITAEFDWEIDNIIFWTDSTTVLQYIYNESRRFHRFVATRLEEIHEHTKPDQWRYVPGRLNPADDGSRGLSIEAFTPGYRVGPDFLHQSMDQWPSAKIVEVPENDVEVLKKQVCQNVVVADQGLPWLLKRLSSWPKLQRCVSWLIRSVTFLQHKSTPLFCPNQITLIEMKVAARVIIKLAQLEYFQSEILALESERKIKSNSRLVSLNPVMKNGVLCVGGRLKHAPLATEAINPMIVPNEHHVAELIISYYHHILGHAEREHVLSVVRQWYWVLNAWALTRQILRRCTTCRRYNEMPMAQKMGDLPGAKLTPYKPPFTFTGLDIFGPFSVKRGRSSQKIYGCIFVCFTTRAVHIEDVGSLETDTFILALRRFISVRGAVKELWSDNGTNSTAGEKELSSLKREWNQRAITKATHEKGVEWQFQPFKQWHFQPPTASHMSGVWERLIRSVRKVMKAILGHPHAFIDREALRTLFAEVVGILNTRPLCSSSDDPKDTEALTPSHSLQQRQGLAIPSGVFEYSEIFSRKKWKRAQVLANQFWVRWVREYLPILHERKKWFLPKRNLQVNDLVLVVDSIQPRSHWNLGRVTKVFPGRDSLVRAAEVKTKSSNYVRPITKLCLLEEAK